ncbi:MAG TPA: acyl-CoA synthetase, partial [Polyangiaceae bacterium LLY-WYZ-14_1]|nr:acyl-CoA synthetase [Polyangiaceae bacterium LLY-WYZ-14_1]
HYPQDLEWAVGELEGVRRGNVVAFSVMRDGIEHLVMAAEGNRSDAGRLKKEIAQRIAETFGIQPAHVAISPLGTLPKTSSGKAQRAKTKRLYEEGDLDEHDET